MGRSKNRKTTKLKKNPNYQLGEIITKSGLKIKYPKAFPLIDFDKIIRNPKNIKLHSKEQVHDIAELIKMVGFKDPVVLDEHSIMFAGHGRLDAAILLEMPKVPWYPLSNLTEEQKKVFLIMDNKVNESAWVSENVKKIFEEVPIGNLGSRSVRHGSPPMNYEVESYRTGSGLGKYRGRSRNRFDRVSQYLPVRRPGILGQAGLALECPQKLRRIGDAFPHRG